MRDFTLHTYRNLLQALQDAGYGFYTFEEYCLGKAMGKFVILRHDVDAKVLNTGRMALLEAECGVRASYYFRAGKHPDQVRVIQSVVRLKHELGYHYNELSTFYGDTEKSMLHFGEQLAYFRQFYPVRTICMHGSPTSKYDNRDLWKKYSYRDYDIIGEPYFDVDFNKMFYLTDTGRCWDGEKYSLRDKVKSTFNNSYHSTFDIINAVANNTLPTQIMMTTHPQRWTDDKISWLVEMVMQNIKNGVKRFLVGRN